MEPSGKQKETNKYQEVCHKITKADSTCKIGECLHMVRVFSNAGILAKIDTGQPATQRRGVQTGL